MRARAAVQKETRFWITKDTPFARTCPQRNEHAFENKCVVRVFGKGARQAGSAAVHQPVSRWWQMKPHSSRSNSVGRGRVQREGCLCEGTDSDGPGELERRQRHIDVPYRELSRGCVDDARIARIRRLRAAVWWRYNRCRYDIKPKGGAATGLPNKEANTAKVELDARENSSSGHAAAQADKHARATGRNLARDPDERAFECTVITHDEAR